MSKLVEPKNKSKYLTGYLYEVIRPSFWDCLKWVDRSRPLKIRGYENKNNKLMRLPIDHDKLLEK